MNNEAELAILVTPGGMISFVYDDDLASVFGDEEQHTIRASRVDYDNLVHGWMVDVLTPTTQRERELLGEYASGHWFWSHVIFEGDCWIKTGAARCGSLARRHGVDASHIRRIRRGVSGTVYKPPQYRSSREIYAPLRLGPFASRQQALAAERTWLRDNLDL